MKISSKLNNLRIAPRKVRLVANLIKGITVYEAEKQLLFLSKRSAEPLKKLLDSAVANAKNNFKTDAENLIVKNIIVNAGPILKRRRPRSRGMANPIEKKTSHIEIILEQKTQNSNIKIPNKSK